MPGFTDTTIKQHIARQFSRAAAGYSDAAQVQQRIADDALRLLPRRGQRLLDIGCGPGRVTTGLQEFASQVVGLDLAYGMVRTASDVDSKVVWLQGDAEALPLCDQSVDRVFSSMALQWCRPLNPALEEIRRVLLPGGTAIITLMVDGAFFELNDGWQHVDPHSHVNRFSCPDDLIAQAGQLGFEVQSRLRDYTTYHANVRELLGSIKAIGANLVLDRKVGYLGRNTLKALEHNYRALYGEPRGLPLTYRILTLELTP